MPVAPLNQGKETYDQPSTEEDARKIYPSHAFTYARVNSLPSEQSQSGELASEDSGYVFVTGCNSVSSSGLAS